MGEAGDFRSGEVAESSRPLRHKRSLPAVRHFAYVGTHVPQPFASIPFNQLKTAYFAAFQPYYRQLSQCTNLEDLNIAVFPLLGDSTGEWMVVLLQEPLEYPKLKRLTVKSAGPLFLWPYCHIRSPVLESLYASTLKEILTSASRWSMSLRRVVGLEGSSAWRSVTTVTTLARASGLLWIKRSCSRSSRGCPVSRNYRSMEGYGW